MRSGLWDKKKKKKSNSNATATSQSENLQKSCAKSISCCTLNTARHKTGYFIIFANSKLNLINHIDVDCVCCSETFDLLVYSYSKSKEEMLLLTL